MGFKALSGFALICLLGLGIAPANAVRQADKQLAQKQFIVWLKGPMWRKAAAHGISRSTYVKAFKPVELNWTLPDLALPHKLRKSKKPVGQSEFRAPGRYFKDRHLAYNIKQGRKELGKWRKTLGRIEKRYGVPKEIIIAIWGKETAFGRAKLRLNAIEVLATQAFMGRRKALFEKELLAALTILEQKHIGTGQMRSAWAGALGHPQFMPSAFLKYAVDFDGDGRKNIWTSIPDALASIGNYLNKHGWDKSRHWGVEVHIPKMVSCTLEGPDQRIITRTWRNQGVKRIDKTAFSARELEKNRYLLLPAGRYGPAFLVSDNFYVLKSYNESDVYALFIGHVADRMKQGEKFRTPWRSIESFSRYDVKTAQRALENKGHDVGGADGLIGYKTRIAVGLWQEKNGKRRKAANCFPNRADLQAIRNQ